MKVLVACEFSGTVRDAFRALGHDAWSCDLLPTDADPKYHYQEDVYKVLQLKKWDMLIAHPPCTYLTNAGVCHLHTDRTRWEKMKQGAKFFKNLLQYPIKYVAVENPIMHKYAVRIIGRRQDQVIHPWMFGHKEQKATCLWLKNLPKLKPTKNVKEQMLLLPKAQRERVHWLPPSQDRWKLRSKTYSGIAKAMAQQWGNLNA